MKQLCTALFLVFFCVSLSCTLTNKFISEKLQSLEGKEEITVVLFGTAFSDERWLAETGLTYGKYLKQELETLLESRISMINSSVPNITFSSARTRIQEDVLSFRPDIVFLKLGTVDAVLTPIDKETFRINVKELLDIFQNNKIFVIMSTATGFRDFDPVYDIRLDRLKEFNEIIIWEAGLHRFPVIDVAQYMENLRITGPDEYASMFQDEYFFNDKGQEYIASYVMNRIKKAFKKSTKISDEL
ncbi:MAG TPA: SGNH/GDSL hydrolase family protein [Anaerolineae bacterium]|nr:SGNH/GDSL hydrolase family protein [Anaerolineae bacterium]